MAGFERANEYCCRGTTTSFLSCPLASVGKIIILLCDNSPRSLACRLLRRRANHQPAKLLQPMGRRSGIIEGEARKEKRKCCCWPGLVKEIGEH